MAHTVWATQQQQDPLPFCTQSCMNMLVFMESKLKALPGATPRNQHTHTPIHRVRPCLVMLADYYISYTTIELMTNSLAAKTKLKGMLEIISAATEFDSLAVRPGEVCMHRLLCVCTALSLCLGFIFANSMAVTTANCQPAVLSLFLWSFKGALAWQ